MKRYTYGIYKPIQSSIIKRLILYSLYSSIISIDSGMRILQTDDKVQQAKIQRLQGLSAAVFTDYWHVIFNLTRNPMSSNEMVKKDNHQAASNKTLNAHCL